MNNFNCLDLNIIKEKISNFASINEARDLILQEDIIFNPLIIKKNSIETKEAMAIISDNINIQFSGIININESLLKAEKNITLESTEIKDILVFHNNCLRIKNIFNSIDQELRLKDYSDSINIHKDIFNRINDCVDNAGEIKEDASILLKELNSNINNTEKNLYKKADEFVSKHMSSLQEQSIYLRDNRITFLIKNSDKNKYGGYAYGTSASGLASYIEPQIFVDLNNEMISLNAKKQEEINKILQELTYLIANISDDLKRNFDSLVKLNVIFAKANYGIKNNAIIPKFCDDKYFDFKDLCHPLLDQERVVSNSYRVYKPYKGIVISGSNTGGKTVSLKAIGISILMSYIGIPIIASDATIPLYKNVFVDIDDNQSIQDSLSTFSAHISNINRILTNADENSLILIDELISGTDPKEAQAISLAIMDKIKSLGSIFVITTHFDDIKNYSYKDENILLSSVGFDTNSLKPTYKYIENSIGSSNALEIASRYLDDKSLIDSARNYMRLSQTKQDVLLKKLEKELDDVNKIKEEVNDKNMYYHTLINEVNEEKNRFENEKNDLRNKYINDLNDYIEDIKDKANLMLASIAEEKNEKIINELDELLIDNKTISNKEYKFNIGDNVRINDNEQIGTIIEINGNKISININGLTIKTDMNNLTLMPKIEKKNLYVERKINSSVPKEINLVGQRVEDGIVLMEEYLDKANGARISSVKVIHGIGSGALRSALRDRMKKLSYIKSFKDGDFYDGGSAVTIVEFK